MAVKDSNQDQSKESQAGVFTGSPSAQQEPVQQTYAGNTAFSPSLRSGQAFGSVIGKGIGNEHLTKIADNLREIYKQADPKYKINVLTIDNSNELGSYFSCILVCMEASNVREKVAVHPMIVEATASPLSNVFETINGQQIEVLRTPGQALDDKLGSLIERKVQTAYPSRKIILIQGEVIPRDFNPEDKIGMHMLAYNSGFACGTELAYYEEGFEDFNLAKEPKDSSLVVDIGFMPNQIKNVVGEPMRSDALIAFSSQKKAAVNTMTSVNSGDRQIKISEISAYIDLVWNPTMPQSPIGGYQAAQLGQGELPTQKYSARAIVTNLASETAYTPSALLLAFSMISTLSTSNNWMQAFRPQAIAGEIDYHDVGAMNIEANIYNETDKNGYGSRVDTKSSAFTLQNLGQYLQSIIRPGLIISMDCPEAGPQTWYQSLFSMAERGNQNAINDIINAANQLTNNNFNKYFTRGGQIFFDTNNIVHTGYWTDKSQQRRDIRDVDSIFVANVMGERNPVFIRDWQDTFLRTEYPMNMRLAARKKFIMGLTNETAVITGFARRVTFSGAFLAALNQGIKDTNLSFRINTPLSSADMQDSRGAATFAGQAILMPSQAFVSQSSMPYAGSMVGSYNFGGRYSGV